MSLIIATGSNLGDRKENLLIAKKQLQQKFSLIASSRIYESPAVDYLNQPDFYNQVLEFEVPNLSPKEIMRTLLSLEEKLGRIRKTLRGPRVIDLDILFLGITKLNDPYVTLPHPRLFERSFVVLPLKELPYYSELSKHYEFLDEFSNKALPVES